jgi:hypothetical protein
VDPVENGRAEDPRVDEIRRDIGRARTRIAETVDALEYKADVPARLGDVLSAATSSVATRIMQRMPLPSSRDQTVAVDRVSEDRVAPGL